MEKLAVHKITLLAVTFIICFGATFAIECFDCNSAYDPRCGDPFDNYTIAKVDCDKFPPLEHLEYVGHSRATLCRKTIMKIYGKIRIVRGCGYLPAENDDGACMKRSGTHDVQAFYCSCTTSMCNSGINLKLNNGLNNLINISIILTIINIIRSMFL